MLFITAYTSLVLGLGALVSSTPLPQSGTDSNVTILDARDGNITMLDARDYNGTILDARDNNITTLEARDNNITILDARDHNITILDTRDGNTTILDARDSNATILNARDSNITILAARDMGDLTGYTMGFATQDGEPAGQQSICTTNCPTKALFTSTAGPNPLPANVFAAAINPAMGGAPDSCAPCGSCYSIKTTHQPYCAAGDTGCAVPTGTNDQGGPNEIKVMITNHCSNCNEVAGHFDINAAPGGWDNPKIYWKQLDPSQCQ